MCPEDLCRRIWLFPTFGKNISGGGWYLFDASVLCTCPPELANLFIDLGLRVTHSFRLGFTFHRDEDSTRVNTITIEKLLRALGRT